MYSTTISLYLAGTKGLGVPETLRGRSAKILIRFVCPVVDDHNVNLIVAVRARELTHRQASAVRIVLVSGVVASAVQVGNFGRVLLSRNL